MYVTGLTLGAECLYIYYMEMGQSECGCFAVLLLPHMRNNNYTVRLLVKTRKIYFIRAWLSVVNDITSHPPSS